MTRHEPSVARVWVVIGGAVLASACLVAGARSLSASGLGPSGVLGSILGGVLFALVGSIGERLVHRYLMHGRSRLPLLGLVLDRHHLGPAYSTSGERLRGAPIALFRPPAHQRGLFHAA